ncbi:MAG: NifB/NifX family molybdenum-iron cluster-binding protein [Desulfuromonadaceae bacterium]|nr:NifB/NifX family molybdenum-iron cluster-binding protein [Desulfuromonadaceae bacterium]
MKAGITIWNDRIAPVFDVAGMVLVLDIANPATSVETMPLPQSLFAKIEALVQSDVEVLVCGAISRPLLRSACAAGLKVIPFAAGSVAEVIQALRSGDIEAVAGTMPGCGCQQRGRQNHATPRQHGRGAGCRRRTHALGYPTPEQ